MATLNLIPNPMVLGVQIGLFYVNFLAVKTLFVKPYLSVRDRRQALTFGSQDEATKALARCDRISKDIESRYINSATEAKADREQLREQAQIARQTLLSAAEKDAKAEIANVEKQIREDLASEKEKIPGVIKTLSDEVYKLALI